MAQWAESWSVLFVGWWVSGFAWYRCMGWLVGGDLLMGGLVGLVGWWRLVGGWVG